MKMNCPQFRPVRYQILGAGVATDACDILFAMFSCLNTHPRKARGVRRFPRTSPNLCAVV
jgi:hypothetical protein